MHACPAPLPACLQLASALKKKGYKPHDAKHLKHGKVRGIAQDAGVPLAPADGTYTADQLLVGISEPATNGYTATGSRENACGASAHACALEMHASWRWKGGLVPCVPTVLLSRTQHAVHACTL